MFKQFVPRLEFTVTGNTLDGKFSLLAKRYKKKHHHKSLVSINTTFIMAFLVGIVMLDLSKASIPFLWLTAAHQLVLEIHKQSSDNQPPSPGTQRFTVSQQLLATWCLPPPLQKTSSFILPQSHLSLQPSPPHLAQQIP